MRPFFGHTKQELNHHLPPSLGHVTANNQVHPTIDARIPKKQLVAKRERQVALGAVALANLGAAGMQNPNAPAGNGGAAASGPGKRRRCYGRK
jgi:hypothetical protein